MSILEKAGLSVSYGYPLGGSRAIKERIRLTDQLVYYRQTNVSIGGYWEASITLRDELPVLEDWFDEGLGRDILSHGSDLEWAWNGFVNKIVLRQGGHTSTRGPLMQVDNEVWLDYGIVDTSVTPPIMGKRVSTAVYQNAASQRLYGVLQRALSTGGVASDALAAYVAQTHLAEHKDPETSKDYTGGTGSPPSVHLECLGYAHLFKKFVYNSTTEGEQALSAKLLAVLAADPNGIFSTDYSLITANAMQVGAWEADNDLAWTIIRELLKKGDINANRYLFGIYANRQAIYEQAPSQLTYQQRITGGDIQTIPGGDTIRPWQVRPGRWLFQGDFLAGRTPPFAAATMEAARQDPRYTFLESVSFTAPYGLDWNGSKVNRLPQILGRLGLSGIGA